MTRANALVIVVFTSERSRLKTGLSAICQQLRRCAAQAPRREAAGFVAVARLRARCALRCRCPGSDGRGMEQSIREHLSQEHVDASLSALDELSRIVSAAGPKGHAPRRSLVVRIGCVDHGAFLSPVLQGFSIAHATPEGVLTGPGDGELVYAVVLLQPVESQIRTVLSFLGTLIERQRLIARGEFEVTELEGAAQEVDRQTADLLDDRLRRDDWREVAASIRERAFASGFALETRVASPLLDPEEIATRSPVLRRVYNEIEPVRSMVDRVAGLFGSSLTIEGPGASEAAMSIAREILDLGDLRRYSAQLIRDVHVCGNGYLLLPPPSGPRLIMAEDISHDGRQWLVRGLRGHAAVPVEETSILHLQGMHQTSGRFGMSLLEPFVVHLAQIDIMREVIEDAVPLASAGDDRARQWATRIEPFARAHIVDAFTRIEGVLAGGAAGLPAPPADLYFPGHQLMGGAAPRLTYIPTTGE